MDCTIYDRTTMLIGVRRVETLKKSKVAVIGIGGVGSHCVESLARAGVGRLLLLDSDVITYSNINRQIHALHSTIGQSKVDAMKARILDINPMTEVEIIHKFITAQDDLRFLTGYDYVVDAVDTVTAKLQIIEFCSENDIRIISSMGTGNKLNADMFLIEDIHKTSVCPLAKVMRKELKKRNIEKLKVVYSKEQPIKACISDETKRVPASISFVPAVAGYLLAGEVIKGLIGI